MVVTDGIHLVANSKDELHVFAARIGLRRKSYRHRRNRPHYLLHGEMKARAIDAGALFVSGKELIYCVRKMVDIKAAGTNMKLNAAGDIIPERYIKSNTPPGRLVMLIDALLVHRYFITYPFKLRDDHVTSMAVADNKYEISYILNEIKKLSYVGQFALNRYGYIVHVDINHNRKSDEDCFTCPIQDMDDIEISFVECF